METGTAPRSSVEFKVRGRGRLRHDFRWFALLHGVKVVYLAQASLLDNTVVSFLVCRSTVHSVHRSYGLPAIAVQ